MSDYLSKLIYDNAFQIQKEEFEAEEKAEKEAKKKTTSKPKSSGKSTSKLIDEIIAKRKSKLTNSYSDKQENTFLDSIFTQMTEANGSNSIFGYMDTDKNTTLTDEELMDYDLFGDDGKEAMRKDIDFIFSAIDEDQDGILTQEELDKLNGGLYHDDNAEAIKKLMVMMDMNIEVSAKKTIQNEIDKMFLGMNKKPETQNVLDALASSSMQNYGDSNYNPSGISDSSTQTKTIADYNAEIAKKETEKQQIIANIDNQIKGFEAQIQETLISSGITPEKMAQHNLKTQEIDTQIQAQDSVIQIQNTTIQNCNAQFGGIDSTIQAYNEQIGNLEASKTANSSDSEAQTRISGKISNLKNAIAQEEAKRIELQQQIQTAQEEITKAQEEKTRLENEKSALLDELMNSEGLPQETKDKVAQLKQSISQAKADKEAKIKAIDAEILTLKTEKNKLERKEESDKLIDANKESSFDANGKRIGTRKYPQTAEEYAQYGLKSESSIKAFERCDQRLKDAYIDMSDWCREQGIYIQVNSSYRSSAAQAKIYANGTNPLGAKPGTSLHERGLAIDVRPYYIENGKITDRRGDNSVYAMMGAYWQDVLGWEWLGDRNNLPEKWHFEIS